MLELGVEADRAGLVAEWRAVPRGWYAGGAAFREWTVGLAEKPLRHARPSSPSGAVKREHGEADAERLVGVGLPLQAIRRVQDRPDPELAGFKERLEGAYLGQ